MTAYRASSARLRSSATRKPVRTPSISLTRTRRRTTWRSSGCRSGSWLNPAPVHERWSTRAASSPRIWSAATARASFFSAVNCAGRGCRLRVVVGVGRRQIFALRLRLVQDEGLKLLAAHSARRRCLRDLLARVLLQRLELNALRDLVDPSSCLRASYKVLSIYPRGLTEIDRLPTAFKAWTPDSTAWSALVLRDLDRHGSARPRARGLSPGSEV